MLDKRPLLRAGALCAMALSLAACSAEAEKGGRGAPEVGYVIVAVQPVPVTTSLGGRTVAFPELDRQANQVVHAGRHAAQIETFDDHDACIEQQVMHRRRIVGGCDRTRAGR